MGARDVGLSQADLVVFADFIDTSRFSQELGLAAGLVNAFIVYEKYGEQ
jgi:hypothetical protein